METIQSVHSSLRDAVAWIDQAEDVRDIYNLEVDKEVSHKILVFMPELAVTYTLSKARQLVEKGKMLKTYEVTFERTIRQVTTKTVYVENYEDVKNRAMEQIGNISDEDWVNKNQEPPWIFKIQEKKV